jgi:hypothetical protein
MSKNDQIARAKKDLAARLGQDEQGITLVSAVAAQWPDASLGVGEPHMGFAMVMIDGYVIVLEAGARRYTYHGDEDRRVVRAD